MMVDKIIIGAGLYGLYSALYCGKKNENVLVIEKDDQAFKRATYINQARVHMGYHYPRSYSTAIKSANYFEKFNKDYGFSILTEFDQIYATSKHFSWTNAKQFKKFCDNAKIMCEEVPTDKYFNSDMCDGAFLTEEYTYDAHILRDFLLKEIRKYSNIQIKYSTDITKIYKQNTVYTVVDSNKNEYSAPFILNSTYASTNEINKLLGFEPFKIKYELCEIILCEVNDVFKNTGITVMDGPFFSIMPFGKTGYHSLTSVTFTPHQTSYDELPTFGCQAKSNGFCTPEKLGNCNDCPAKPVSAWESMSTMARKYLKDKYQFKYVKSLYSMKPILMASEIDDSRPTVIKKYSNNPTFVSVLSGKINTVYDLEKILNDK
ncbi:FAD-binding oxidoreductase [Coprobacillus sp. AM42-12AC]|nr:FAD-binding oxidoreductase [Coprobacillus sp. AM42-12AC]